MSLADLVPRPNGESQSGESGTIKVNSGEWAEWFGLAWFSTLVHYSRPVQ